MEKVAWGVLGAAKIALEKVIPAMQRGRSSRVVAIASRSYEKARDAARKLGIPRAYGSYEELLADKEVEAVYNPLPNDLHVPWSIRAAEAGKHVLCEKPIAFSSEEARSLLAARERTGVIITEAFMVRSHPQWLAARDLVRSGRIGSLRAMQGFFSYHLLDPKNIRNVPHQGGGGLMDIGCYPVVTSRFIFEDEPRRVMALIERDPEMGIDRLASGLLDFGAGQSSFTCATQAVPYQRMHMFGNRGRIEVEIPFNAPPDRPTRIFVDSGADVFGGGIETVAFPVTDQYTVQGDLFSGAVRGESEPEFPLEDAVSNMRVIEALFRSAGSGTWENP